MALQLGVVGGFFLRVEEKLGGAHGESRIGTNKSVNFTF
jgi:hypothetical protein